MCPFRDSEVSSCRLGGCPSLAAALLAALPLCALLPLASRNDKAPRWYPLLVLTGFVAVIAGCWPTEVGDEARCSPAVLGRFLGRIRGPRSEPTATTATTTAAAMTAPAAAPASQAWLDLVANEIVAIIETIGIAFNISTTILGLTVVGIGNSVGDLVADTARGRMLRVARLTLYTYLLGNRTPQRTQAKSGQARRSSDLRGAADAAGLALASAVLRSPCPYSPVPPAPLVADSSPDVPRAEFVCRRLVADIICRPPRVPPTYGWASLPASAHRC